MGRERLIHYVNKEGTILHAWEGEKMIDGYIPLFSPDGQAIVEGLQKEALLNKQAKQAVDKFFDTPTPDSDPYWSLFGVTNKVHDSIIEAVKYGFEQGYKTAKGEQ